MSHGLIYFNFSIPHLARLAVSLWTLRKVYAGPVAILNAGGDRDVIARLGADERLKVDVVPIEIPQRRRHTAYVAKPSLWRWTPYDCSLYLDADTIVTSDPRPAFSVLGGIVVTRFSNWVTTGRIYSSRIRQWLTVEHPQHDIKGLAKNVLDKAFPAINTGVFLFNRNNRDLESWEAIAQAGHECSFTDELALQILLPTISCGWLSDQWNASPIYHHCRREDAKIWHFHGCKNLRKDVGKDIWLPVFGEVFHANVGGIQEWYRLDKSLKGFQL